MKYFVVRKTCGGRCIAKGRTGRSHSIPLTRQTLILDHFTISWLQGMIKASAKKIDGNIGRLMRRFRLLGRLIGMSIDRSRNRDWQLGSVESPVTHMKVLFWFQPSVLSDGYEHLSTDKRALSQTSVCCVLDVVNVKVKRVAHSFSWIISQARRRRIVLGVNEKAQITESWNKVCFVPEHGHWWEELVRGSQQHGTQNRQIFQPQWFILSCFSKWKQNN